MFKVHSFLVSRIGDRCSRHYDCTSPFSACVNQQCVCISGTTQQGSKCVASTNCPLGGSPGTMCTRRAQLNQVFALKYKIFLKKL